MTDQSHSSQERSTGSPLVKRGLAEMLKGGVIMDVVNPEQARIAEDAGAVAVMALERVPSDIRKEGGVSRMSDPEMIQGIQAVCSIPVMAKARIGHFAEAQILQSLGVDYIDRPATHWPSRYVPKFGETGARYNFALEHDHVSFEEQLEAMADHIKAGKVKAWGVSNETTFGVATFVAIAKLKGLPPPVSIQNDYSLCDRRFETELAEARRPGSKRNERTKERTNER